jgi:hypothetical protein
MTGDELSPEQEAEIARVAADAVREAERVGVDWSVAQERMRALSRQEVRPSADGAAAEVTIELDLTLLLRTLRALPDGAGTERFLAAYEAAGPSDASPAG